MQNLTHISLLPSAGQSVTLSRRTDEQYDCCLNATRLTRTATGSFVLFIDLLSFGSGDAEYKTHYSEIHQVVATELVRANPDKIRHLLDAGCRAGLASNPLPIGSLYYSAAA